MSPGSSFSFSPRISTIVSAVIDALGICKVPALSLICEFDLKREAQLVSLLTGWQVDGEALFKIGERIFNLENLFNVRNSPWLPRAGIPGMFCQKPLTDGPSLGQTVDLESMVQDFYGSMGWDTEGRPRCSTLKNLEIAEFARSGECV